MEEITVYSLDYYQMSKEIKREIVHLLHVVWPSDDCNDAHNEELTVQSFYIMKIIRLLVTEQFFGWKQR